MFAKLASAATIALVALTFAIPAWSQEPPPVRIRGTIEHAEDPAYVVKNRDGAEVKLVMAEKPSIAGIVKASLSDIKPGSFVGRDLDAAAGRHSQSNRGAHLSGSNARNR
jgi:hypothetical protein